MATITKRNINLISIDKDCKEQWYNDAKKYIDVSHFECRMLRLVGDALRQPKSQFFWCDGAYCWFTDESQSNVQCVWLTTNGNCVFEDCSTHSLYNVYFKD